MTAIPSPGTDRAAESQRLPLDVPAERGPARLRLLGSLCVGVAAIWIFASHPGTGGVVVALAALLACVGWAASYARASRTIRAASAHFIAWDSRTLTLAAGKDQHQVPWAEITDIVVDEERLVVVVERGSAPSHRVEPRYGGLGVYALGERLRTARAEAAQEIAR